jgi:zinc protease
LNPHPKDDVRYVPTLEESIALVEATTLDQIKKLYADQIGGTEGELVIVGDFDAEKTPGLVDKILDGWKSSVAYKRIDRKGQITTPAEKIVINTPDKENAVYVAGHALAMRDDDPDYAGMEVGNFLLGGGTLSSRLGDRVRQKEGLTYGVQSVFTADDRDPYGRFLVYAICAPQNIDKVDKAIKEELERILKDGVSQTELDDGVKAFLNEAKTSRGDDSRLVSLVSSELAAGRTLKFLSEFEKKVGALTPADVNKALKNQIDLKRMVIIRAGDFNKK